MTQEVQRSFLKNYWGQALAVDQNFSAHTLIQTTE
jgi:hypothetical protein